MSDLPQFSSLTQSFPEQAVQSLYQLEQNTISYRILKMKELLGLDSAVLEDSYGNKFRYETNYKSQIPGYSLCLLSLSNPDQCNNLLITKYVVTMPNNLNPVLATITSIGENAFKDVHLQTPMVILEEFKHIYPNAFNGFQGDILYLEDLSQITEDFLNMMLRAFICSKGGTFIVSNQSYQYGITESIFLQRDGKYYFHLTPMEVIPYSQYLEQNAKEITIPKNMILPKITSQIVEGHNLGIFGDNITMFATLAYTSTTSTGSLSISRDLDQKYRKIIFTEESSFIIDQNIPVTTLILDVSETYGTVFIPYVPSFVIGLHGFKEYIGTMDLRDCSITADTVKSFFFVRTIEGSISGVSSFESTCEGVLILSSEQYGILSDAGLLNTSESDPDSASFWGASKLKIKVQEKEATV